MTFTKKLRKIGHDLYYKNATASRLEYALKCQDVTAKIDLHKKPESFSGFFRFWFHLSLCQACKNYYDVSQILSLLIKKNVSKSLTPIQEINKKLLTKYAKYKKDSTEVK